MSLPRPKQPYSKVTMQPPIKEAPFEAKNFSGDGKRHVLLACPGFMEATELPKLLHKLAHHARFLSIRIILAGKTDDQQQQQQRNQTTDDCLLEISGVDGLHHDERDWNCQRPRGMPTILNELLHWADVFVVAPLGKMVLTNIIEGLYDDLVTSIIRTWDKEALMGFKVARIEPHLVPPDIQVEGDKKFACTVPENIVFSSSALHATSPIETQIVRERKVVIVVPEAAGIAMWTSPVRNEWMRFLQASRWLHILGPLRLIQLPFDGENDFETMNWFMVAREIERTLLLRS